jgi:hypothetical protein
MVGGQRLETSSPRWLLPLTDLPEQPAKAIVQQNSIIL